jgi:hypothetical protein
LATVVSVVLGAGAEQDWRIILNATRNRKCIFLVMLMIFFSIVKLTVLQKCARPVQLNIFEFERIPTSECFNSLPTL